MGLPQIKERVSCLSGEIKAAREAQGECRQARDDQKRLLDIAEQAVERADARVSDLEAERAQLAEQAREAILATGESVEAAPNGFVSVFSQPPDFQAEALANGEAKINQAFDEATR